MRTESSAKFWQRIHGNARDKGFPLRVMFELTYRCNFYCQHCYVPLNYRKKAELKTKEVFSIIDQLADTGCFYLGFTGGEPLVREDAMEIFRYARKKGFEVIIYTNGCLIDNDKADALAELALNKVDITIHAMTRAPFERITGIPGSHAKVFEGIELLRKRDVRLGFKTCVLKDNQKEIKEIEAFAASLNALHRLDDMLSARLDGSREPFQCRGSVERKGTESARCSALPKEEPRGNKKMFWCGVGISQAAITPQGELKMCLMVDEPRFSILEGSLERAWSDLKSYISSIKPNKDYRCHTCDLQDFCKWCPAKGWLYNKNFSSCDPENRKKAELIKELVYDH